VEGTPPRRPGLDLLLFGADEFPVVLPPARVNIDLVGAEPAGPLPEVADDPEEDHDGEGEVNLEEGLGILGLDGSVELGGDAD
jgi:hypothetical protein